MSNAFYHGEGLHANSSWTHFNRVVNFEEIRVFQTCTCDQRFKLTQVPNRYCCALGALRKCAYFPFLVLPHYGGLSLCARSAPRDWLVRPLHSSRTNQRASIHHISLVAEPMEPIHAELLRLATELEAVKVQEQTECSD